MNHIIDSENFRESEIGTKARNLFIMRENGVNVPSLFCIGAGYPGEYLLDGEIEKERIENILSQIDFSNEESLVIASEKIRQIIATLRHNTDYARAIVNNTDHYLKGTTTFAVRSSSSVEDRLDASFAGQFATYLDVDKSGLVQSVTDCFASLYQANVLRYCHHKNIPLSDLHMNVVIQEMVTPDLSGIVFTVNPQGLLNESVIVVGEGVGDNVVMDKVPTTSYYYNLTDNVYYYESREGSPLLSVTRVHELMDTTSGLKPLFGEFLDIEFAIKSGKIYILQARPITSMAPQKQLILDNSNIVESYPNISLPLTDSFVCEAYYQVFRGLASRCLKNEKLLKRYDGDLHNMVGSANGRMYYKISNWYAVLNFLPLSKKIIPIWQDMMGVTDKAHEEYKKELTFLQNIKVYFNCIYEAFHIQKGMQKLNDDFIETVQHFNAGYKAGLPTAELLKLYNSVSDKVLSNWDITLLNDIYAFVFTGLLKNKLKKLKIEDYESYTNEYISGMANIESMKPVKALVDLACFALSSNSIEDLKRLQNDQAAREYFDKSNTAFSNMCLAFIDVYGDRSLEELKLESKTFRTSPLMLVQKILEYTSDEQRLENIAKSINTENKIENIAHKGNFFDKKLLAYFSKKAMLGISNREISRLNRSRIYGFVRTLYLAIGANMRDANQLESKRDIFYLYSNEVFENQGAVDFKNTVSKRKQEYNMYQKLPAYSKLVFSGEIFNKNHTNINADTVAAGEDDISGIPCSNGMVEGEVLVIDSPQNAVNAKDKILVAKMTDPGWVFLITMAKGIITEKGSLLSHTAIISRELGIASIVGVKNITNILKTGDKIKMNGSNGKIEMVSEKIV